MSKQAVEASLKWKASSPSRNNHVPHIPNKLGTRCTNGLAAQGTKNMSHPGAFTVSAQSFHFTGKRDCPACELLDKTSLQIASKLEL